VPSWNTELQVLYWLASRDGLEKDDTLALAIAMVNGLWITMGVEKVREAVLNHANGLLDFGTETIQMQKALRVSFDLQRYLLEAKVCLAWTANSSPRSVVQALM